MKYLDKQIEKIVKNKNRAENDLKDCQMNLSKAILERLNHADKMPLSQSDCERYLKEMNHYFTRIEHCNLVISELITLKQMNEG